MKEPKRIKLTDSPESKKVNLTPLPSNNYPETMDDDVYQKTKNENYTQNNSQSIQQLESEPTD